MAIAVHPITGEVYIGDVGLATWEEINAGRGKNFGWPFFEGGFFEGVGQNSGTPEYVNNPRYEAIYNDDSDVTPPVYARLHSDGLNSITLGEFYTGDLLPEIYNNALFIADFGGSDRVSALLFDEFGNFDSSLAIANAEGNTTNLLFGPDGDLYLTDLSFSGNSSIINLSTKNQISR